MHVHVSLLSERVCDCISILHTWHGTTIELYSFICIILLFLFPIPFHCIGDYDDDQADDGGTATNDCETLDCCLYSWYLPHSGRSYILGEVEKEVHMQKGDGGEVEMKE